MTTLIITRHGNTFEAGETPRRVGARTDLPLTQQGHLQAQKIGEYLKENNLLPGTVYTSHLQRTIQTAQEILSSANLNLPTQPIDIFNEIDYGPDENQTEDRVIARIGQTALQHWEDDAVLPPGWSPNAETIRADWARFADGITQNETTLVVTSNGIARFALALTNHFDASRKQFSLKLATGAFGILDHTPGTGWAVRDWNIRP